MGSSRSHREQRQPARRSGWCSLFGCGAHTGGGSAGVAEKGKTPAGTAPGGLVRRRSLLAPARPHSPDDGSSGESDQAMSNHARPGPRGRSVGPRARRPDHTYRGRRAGRQDRRLSDGGDDSNSPDQEFLSEEWEMSSSSENSSDDSVDEPGADREGVPRSARDKSPEAQRARHHSASAESDSSSSPRSSASDCSDSDQVSSSKWNRPEYIPLSEDERAIVRQTRRRRQHSAQNSYARQIARRGERTSPLSIVTDLSVAPPMPRVASNRSINNALASGEQDDEPHATSPLRRRSSSVSFTHAVVVTTPTRRL